MDKKKTYCLIDTNTFLHYQLFCDINWFNELNAENITLIICTTVLRELDQKKFLIMI